VAVYRPCARAGIAAAIASLREGTPAPRVGRVTDVHFTVSHRQPD